MVCYGIFFSGQLIAKRTSRCPYDALASGGINFEDSINQHPNKANFVTRDGEAKEVSYCRSVKVSLGGKIGFKIWSVIVN